jgi:subtilisin family serine protease
MESIDYLQHIQINGNNLQYPFILNLRDDCGFHCHNLINQELHNSKRGSKSHNSILNSNERYSIHSHNRGLVSMELTEVQELVNNNPIDILGFKPLIPINKLSSKIKSLATSSNHGSSSSSSIITNDNLCENDKFDIKCKKLLIQIAPLSLHDLDTFKSYIHQLSIDMNSIFFTEEVDIMSIDRMNIISIFFSDCKSTEELTTLLSSRHEILWIEERPNFYTNNRWATSICQGGGSSYSATAPMYYANILGNDELIGVADTGLDMNSCYFYDTIETSFGGIDTSNGRPFTFDAPFNNDHRKVIGYMTSGATSYVDEGGHGTHVCGSVAGLSYINYGDYKKYNGLAVNSKLIFFDIGDVHNQLIVPSDLDDLFSPMYAGGARIFSNSWGSSTANEYNSFAQSADKFMRSHPDALVRFYFSSLFLILFIIN